MVDSADHFQGLVSYVITSINKMLTTGNIVTPIALVVNRDGSIEVVKANATSEKIVDHVGLLQAQLRKKAEQFEIMTSCVAYPDYANNQIIAFLENDDNYCVKLLMPVVNRNGLKLKADKITTEQGAVYIFPVKQLH